MSQDDVETKFDSLLFGVRRSIRYHTRRRMFFDRWQTSGNLIAILFGSATILGVLGQWGYQWTVAAAVLVTVSSAFNLVVGTAAMARLHHDLARRFIELEKKITSATKTEETWRLLNNNRLDIEADEPPVLRSLNILCHNEQVRAEGRPSEFFVRLSWGQRRLAQWVDIGQDHIPPVSQKPV